MKTIYLVNETIYNNETDTKGTITLNAYENKERAKEFIETMIELNKKSVLKDIVEFSYTIKPIRLYED